MKTHPLILSVALLCGCATVPHLSDREPVTRTFNAPKEKVWPVLISEIGLKYPVKAVDAGSGLITTDMMRFGLIGDVANLPQPDNIPFVPRFSGRGSISALLSAEGETCKAQLTLRCEMWNESLKMYQGCQSKGVVESNILEAVAAKLEGREPAFVEIASTKPQPATNVVRKAKGQ